MMRILSVVLLALFALSGCNQEMESSRSSKSRSEVPTFTNGQHIELSGIASVLPDHAEKRNSQGISTEQGDFLFSGQYDPLPDKLIGSRIHVTGEVREKHLPMFEHPNDGSPAPQGIPVPKGTDINNESVYFTIENPIWQLDD